MLYKKCTGRRQNEFLHKLLLLKRIGGFCRKTGQIFLLIERVKMKRGILEEDLKKVRNPEKYKDETIPFLNPLGYIIDVPILRIKNDKKLLARVENEIKDMLRQI